MLAVHREPLESSEGGVAAHAYSSPPASNSPLYHAFTGGSSRKAGASLALARAKGWQTVRWHGVNWVASGERQRANGFERISNKSCPDGLDREFFTALLSLGTHDQD